VARSLSNGTRFAVAYLALGLVGGAALGAFIVFVQRPAPVSHSWSSWKPTTSSTGDTVQAIASHVGDSYRLSTGGRLARAVLDAPASVSNYGVIALASRQTGGVTLANPDSTIMYTLCGTGQNCTVGGTASIARGDVLRREVLELALYTFKYVGDATDVGVFFPPAAGEQNSTNVYFFDRSDLTRQLSHPLQATLPHITPPVPGRLSDRELLAIEGLTGGHRFHFAVQTARSGAKVLVLRPAA
jgi:hypothetical protein